VVRCPEPRDPLALLEWLLAFGEREPGHVLYPTSDDVAWLVSSHREALSRRYRLYAPSPGAMGRLLDKSQLAQGAREAGLDVPDTRCPATEEEAGAMARELGFPLLLKPRSQALLHHLGEGRKGMRVDRPEELRARWRAMRDSLRYHSLVTDHLKGLELPLLQAACAADERIYTVDGFVDQDGHLAALACAKVLQWPRRTGPGVCFEHQPLDQGVAEGLRRLFVASGFHGVFDAEFLIQGERRLLIDLNPRFYNHMAFEVERGLPLPWMAYLAATGEQAALRVALATPLGGPRTPRAYIHRLPTALVMVAQRLAGTMDRPRRDFLQRWISAHRGDATDPARGPGDRLPGLVELLLNLRNLLRHPRAYLRDLVTNTLPVASVSPAAVLPLLVPGRHGGGQGRSGGPGAIAG
jgi:predicted ATP-grasp superfamily ATP-dependent carboligase